VGSRGKELCDAGSFEACLGGTHGGTEASTASSYDYHVELMVNYKL
jgi:hypothetical protein